MDKQIGFGQTVQGYYKVSVVDSDDKVIWESPEWKKNLILNLGMDMIAAQAYSTCFYYAYAGTGTRQNSVLGQDSVITQTGNLVTLNPGAVIQHFTQSAGGYNNILEVGDVIVYVTSSVQATVVTVSDLTCTVDVSQANAGENFVIWKTSQTGLQNPIAAAGGNGVGALLQPSGSYWINGFCGTSLIGNVLQMHRTYDFGLETGLKNYTEIGVGNGYRTYLGGYCFSRILLSVPVAVDVGQRLRVAYQLNISINPSSPVYLKGATQPIITNWPVLPATNTNATESIQSTNYTIEGVNADGTSQINGFGYPLDPSTSGYYCCSFISTDSTPLASFGSAVDRSSNVAIVYPIRASYPGAGSYYCDKIATFGLTQINRSNIRSFGLGYSDNCYQYDRQTYCFLFDQDQTKSNIQTLTLAWRFTWSRNLANGSS